MFYGPTEEPHGYVIRRFLSLMEGLGCADV
jgi:hypothetical protein